MKNEEFEALAKEIGRGADVDQEELAEALCYAGTAWYEIQQLTKSLAAGYRALQKDIERKDRKLEMANKMLAAVRAENVRLREEIRELRGKAISENGAHCAPLQGKAFSENGAHCAPLQGKGEDVE